MTTKTETAADTMNRMLALIAAVLEAPARASRPDLATAKTRVIREMRAA